MGVENFYIVIREGHTLCAKEENLFNSFDIRMLENSSDVCKPTRREEGVHFFDDISGSRNRFKFVKEDKKGLEKEVVPLLISEWVGVIWGENFLEVP